MTDNQSEKNVPKKLVSVTIRIEKSIHDRLKSYAGREKSTITDIAGEAVAYWIYFLAKEARKEGLEAAKGVWLKAHIDRIQRQRPTKIEKALKSRKTWHARYPDKPWPGDTILGKRDVQIPLDLEEK